MRRQVMRNFFRGDVDLGPFAMALGLTESPALRPHIESSQQRLNR